MEHPFVSTIVGSRPQRFFACIFVALTLAALGLVRAEEPVKFGRDILPILSDNCFTCHGPDAKAREADLRLDLHDDALRKEMPVVVPGKSGESELIKRILSTDADEQMPPPKSNKKLSPVQIELLKRWIDEGATWGKHWAFETPVRPSLPVVKGTAWPRNPIDHFVLARLEREGLAPAPEATKETLLRRVSLDLTGLPPTIAELDAFLNDQSPDAYEKVVDRLLKSPRYGERMVWEWLDAARYADTNGYQGDPTRTMYFWRDWVVEALNSNMPFDQFTVEQLAGDLLDKPTQSQLVATGFHRNHMINGEGGRIAEESRIDYVQDRVETTGAVWMGLTFNCCRCHDHKFDPLKQREYYSLAAYFNSIDESGGNDAGGLANPIISLRTPEQETKLESLRVAERESARQRDEISAKLEEAAREKDPELATAKKKAEDAKKEREAFDKNAPRTMIMRERAQPRETFILTRGEYDKPGEKVSHGVPDVLPALVADAPKNRLALARWLVSPDHPLTSRVTVNRYWQSIFGVGLVKTSEDFGVQGERPSHGELLDWLAREFVEPTVAQPSVANSNSKNAWNVKHVLRLIVTSATYRQSSKLAPGMAERDPENRLLARGARHRLPSWTMRDQALFASGLLVEKIGGPPVKGYQPSGVWEEATFGNIRYQPDTGEALYRRSLYQFWRRIVGPAMFFDVASRQTCTVKTARTNTPLHALVTLNDITYVESARALAERILTEAETPEARFERAYRLVVSRKPSERERQVLVAALARLRDDFAKQPDEANKLLAVGASKRNEKLDPIEHAAYTALCGLILNLDETITRE